MANAAIKTMSAFPDIRDDLARVDKHVMDASKELTSKLRQVCYTPLAGTHAYTLVYIMCIPVYGAYINYSVDICAFLMSFYARLQGG